MGKKRQSIRRFMGTVTWPDQMYVKLKWTGSFATAAPGAAEIHYAKTYVGNSPYDPDATGAVNANGWDEFTALYKQYECTASSIRLIGTNSGAGVFSIITILPVTIENQTSLVLDPPSMPYARKTFVGFSSGSKTTFKTKHYMTTKKLIRAPRDDSTMQAFTDIAYGTPTTPAAAWYWRLFVGPYNDQVNVNTSLQVYVTITYYVKFFNRTLPNET